MKRHWVIVNGVLLAVLAAFAFLSNAEAATKKATGHTRRRPAHAATSSAGTKRAAAVTKRPSRKRTTSASKAAPRPQTTKPK